MPRESIACLLVLCMVPWVVTGQVNAPKKRPARQVAAPRPEPPAAPASQSAPKVDAPMVNADVLALVEAGLPDGVVMEKIRSSRTAFDTSTSALVALRRANVSATVIQLMVNPDAAPTAGAAPAGPAAPVGTPEPCTAQVGGQLAFMTGASPAMWYTAQGERDRVEIQYERGTLHRVGFMGIGATLLLLKPMRGQLRLPADATFYSCLNPTDTPLVRFTLDEEDDERHTSVARGGPFKQSFRISDGDLVPVTFTKLPQGFFEIKPRAPLTSGEYGFVPQVGLNYFVAGDRVYAFGVE